MRLRRDPIVAEMLPDGRRLHLRDGPIDLVIEARGSAKDVAAAYGDARRILPGILPALMEEIDLLRAPLGEGGMSPKGTVARAMADAANYTSKGLYATPMIAVAGAVADHVLGAICAGRDLESAYVNNGGDIALYLARGQHFDIGICADMTSRRIVSVAHLSEEDGVGGIATSGWQGRSFSLGIADAVTVLAPSAAIADVAATLIANAVDLPGHSAITRERADVLAPDSDLKGQLVTTEVGTLSRNDRSTALEKGECLAHEMIAQGWIIAAYGSLQGDQFACGKTPSTIDPAPTAASHVEQREVSPHA